MHTIDQHVGAHLRRRRERLHVALSDVATLLGITVEVLTKIEEGKLRATAEQLYVLCQALQTTPEAIYKNAPLDDDGTEGGGQPLVAATSASGAR